MLRKEMSFRLMGSLPWGFTPQDIVADIVKKHLPFENRARMVKRLMCYLLQESEGSLQEGCGAAYERLVKEFSSPNANFVPNLENIIHRDIGKRFDQQHCALLLGNGNPKITLHSINDVKIAYLTLQRPNTEERMSKWYRSSKFMFDWARTQFSNIPHNLGYQLSLVAIIRCNETVHFGPTAGTRLDAMHVLEFRTDDDTQNILHRDSELCFRLYDMNFASRFVGPVSNPCDSRDPSLAKCPAFCTSSSDSAKE